jgi:membrane complex biogenesis BtpA family protein
MSSVEWSRGVAIGMVHFAALPGSPHYQGASLGEIKDLAGRDRDILIEEGFDAISFSNEADRPYLMTAPVETVAMMSHLITGLTADLSIPFGCGVLIDPMATLAVARAVSASFVRVSLGVTAGVFGWEARDSGSFARYRKSIGASGVEILLNVSPHFSSSMDTRDPIDIVQSYVALVEPEGIQVHGSGAGHAPGVEHVKSIKDAVPNVPVLAASGTTAESVGSYLKVCDGVIVGACLKEDGNVWRPVDRTRARVYMDAVRAARGR